MNSAVLEALKILLPVIATGAVTYRYATKGKLRDAHLLKRAELNNVLSSL